MTASVRAAAAEGEKRGREVAGLVVGVGVKAVAMAASHQHQRPS